MTNGSGGATGVFGYEMLDDKVTGDKASHIYNGKEMEYKMYVPSAISADKSFGLLLVFPSDYAERFEYIYLADGAEGVGLEHELITVGFWVPDAKTGEAYGNDRCWWSKEETNTEVLLDFLEDYLFKKYNINPNRIFVTGISGGSFYAPGFSYHSDFKYFGAVIGLCGGDVPRLDSDEGCENLDSPEAPVPDSISKAAKEHIKYYFAM